MAVPVAVVAPVHRECIGIYMNDTSSTLRASAGAVFIVKKRI